MIFAPIFLSCYCHDQQKQEKKLRSHYGGQKRRINTVQRPKTKSNTKVCTIMLSYKRAITATIMELKSQTGLSDSNIKKNITGSSVSDIRKTILTMKELPERKWINAMFLVNLKRMVANGSFRASLDINGLSNQMPILFLHSANKNHCQLLD